MQRCVQSAQTRSAPHLLTALNLIAKAVSVVLEKPEGERDRSAADNVHQAFDNLAKILHIQNFKKNIYGNWVYFNT